VRVEGKTYVGHGPKYGKEETFEIGVECCIHALKQKDGVGKFQLVLSI
jgi:hypothetical protein